MIQSEAWKTSQDQVSSRLLQCLPQSSVHSGRCVELETTWPRIYLSPTFIIQTPFALTTLKISQTTNVLLASPICSHQCLQGARFLYSQSNLIECWPGPKRLIVLTEIYPTFVKPSIQIAGPKTFNAILDWWMFCKAAKLLGCTKHNIPVLKSGSTKQNTKVV